MSADSMPERIPALEVRLGVVEDALSHGLKRIEDLIRREISDLKAEQLKDIKASIDRVEKDLKGEHQRLADDQRRLWDAVRALELSSGKLHGGSIVLRSVAHSVTGIVAGAIGALLTWLLSNR
jgi:hypothetical protein